MEENKKEMEPTREQLLQMIEGLKSQNSQLYMQLQNINMGNLFKRLDYLFKVVEFKEAFSSEFVESSVKEIESIMTPPEKEDNNAE